MNDLVERLRKRTGLIFNQAADRIEELEAENKLVHARMDWTIEDNVKKALRIEELEDALNRIIDYQIPSRDGVIDNADCPQCIQARKQYWPPSGLCDKHYHEHANHLMKEKRDEAMQHFTLRNIAKKAMR